MKKFIVTPDLSGVCPAEIEVISLCKGLDSPLNGVEIARAIRFPNQRLMVEKDLSNNRNIVAFYPIYAIFEKNIIKQYTCLKSKKIRPDTGVVGFVVFSKKSLKEKLSFQRIRSNFSSGRTKEILEYIEEQLIIVNQCAEGKIYNILREDDDGVITETQEGCVANSPEEALNKNLKYLLKEGESEEDFLIEIV